MHEVGSIAKFGADLYVKTADDWWALSVAHESNYLRDKEVDCLGSVIYEATTLVRFAPGTILRGRTNPEILAAKDDRGQWRFVGESAVVFNDELAEAEFDRYWGGYEVLLEVKR